MYTYIIFTIQLCEYNQSLSLDNSIVQYWFYEINIEILATNQQKWVLVNQARKIVMLVKKFKTCFIFLGDCLGEVSRKFKE